MDAIAKTKPFSSYSVLLILFSICGFLVNGITDSDNTNVVYKSCASQKFQDPSRISSQNLINILSSLVSQSGKKGFSSKTSGNGKNAIRGLYQCRGDITNSDCFNCVSKIPDMLNKLCGKSIAARVQLSGCYLWYEIVGFKQVSEAEILYKLCGSAQASGAEFEARREMAFEKVEDGVRSDGENLFYSGRYESLYVLGQCEGDLASDDCENCVKSAEQRAKAECGDSISAQIYLHKCCISYSYNPNGKPIMSSSSGAGNQQIEKVVAIAVGVFAALGFLLVCVLFCKSLMKKRRDKSWG